MKFFKKKTPAPALSREESLARTPVKNVHVRETRLDNGLVEIAYPMEVKPWIASLSGKLGKTPDKPPDKRLQLDELGTWVWDRIDGRSTAADLVRKFCKEQKVLRREAEYSVTRFLYELGRRGIIGLR